MLFTATGTENTLLNMPQKPLQENMYTKCYKCSQKRYKTTSSALRNFTKKTEDVFGKLWQKYKLSPLGRFCPVGAQIKKKIGKIDLCTKFY